jgi:conjugal transfer pilus assembly protein TraD
MLLEKVEVPWRPVYEGYSFYAWLAATLGVLFFIRAAGLPHSIGYVCMGIAAGMTAYRGFQAYTRMMEKEKLGDGSVEFISPEQMRAITSKAAANRQVWMGTGFRWGSEEANLLHHVLRVGPQTIVPKEDLERGNFWIHGLGKDDDLFLDLDDFNGQSLLVGTTRAGKTRFLDLLVTQMILRGEPVIAIDPKGDHDLRENMRRACVMAGDPDRFIYFHPAFPESSAGIDPLGNWNRLTELASRLATLIPSETGADPFTAFGWQAINNVVQGLLLVAERPSLITIRRFIEGGIDPLLERVLQVYLTKHMPGWEDRYAAYLKRKNVTPLEAMIEFYEQEGKDHHSPVLGGLISGYKHNREHYMKMIASLIPVLNMLTSPPLDKLLSPEPDIDNENPVINLAQARRNKMVVYIGLDSLSDSTVGSAIGSLLLADVVAIAGDIYNYEQGNKLPLNLVVDEAAEIANKPLIQLLNKGGGALFRAIVATQTFADFAARLGNANQARQALGNFNNVVALRTIDAETQKYLSESLPPTVIRTFNYNYRESVAPTDLAVFGSGYSESLEEKEGELFPPAMFGQLPNLHWIGRLSKGRIVKGKIPILEDKRKG